jgi:hypothetical protein
MLDARHRSGLTCAGVPVVLEADGRGLSVDPVGVGDVAAAIREDRADGLASVGSGSPDVATA